MYKKKSTIVNEKTILPERQYVNATTRVRVIKPDRVATGCGCRVNL